MTRQPATPADPPASQGTRRSAPRTAAGRALAEAFDVQQRGLMALVDALDADVVGPIDIRGAIRAIEAEAATGSGFDCGCDHGHDIACDCRHHSAGSGSLDVLRLALVRIGSDPSVPIPVRRQAKEAVRASSSADAEVSGSLDVLRDLLHDWSDGWLDPPDDDTLCGACEHNPHADDCVLVRTRAALAAKEAGS